MWSVDRPLIELDSEISLFYQNHAKYLLQDLANNKLEVVLVPAKEQKHPMHMVRRVANRNPKWYRELYSTNSSFRRDLSLQSLDRLVHLKDGPTIGNKNKYDAVYRDLIHSDLTRGYSYQGDIIAPNNLVRRYFGISF